MLQAKNDIIDNIFINHMFYIFYIFLSIKLRNI